MPITKEKFLERIKEKLPELNKDILETAESLWLSGAIDPEDWDSNYALPMVFMSAYADKMRSDYMPITPRMIRERNNLSRII